MHGSGRQIAATIGALGAYASTVLPQVRRELRRWEPLPRAKAKNAEAVAVFATLAPRRRRAVVTRAMVALQVTIDLRDLREEAGEPADAEMIEQLERSWRGELARLPASKAVEPLLRRAVKRCEEGQRQTHAAAAGGTERLRKWADEVEAAGGYRWWEVAAGASSSVAAHALIAAAADPATTAEDAAAIDAAYQPSIGALTVLLDDLVDFEDDRAAGEHNYMSYYASPAEAAARFGLIADRAAAAITPLPRASRHQAILAGVAAFYLGASGAATELGRPIRERLLGSLGPGARLLSAFTRLRH